MSQIALSPNASGTGVFTIESPNSNTSRTLTLPDAAGAVVLDTATQTLTNKTLTSPTINSATLSSPTISGTPVVSGSLITAATAKASTSGTTVDFDSIPSWAKRVTILFNGVSMGADSNNFLIQLGTSGGFVSSGYAASSQFAGSGSTSTSGMVMHFQGNTLALTGIMQLHNITSNTWLATACYKNTGATNTDGNMAGSIALSGTLTQVRITSSAGASFDAGTINIFYE